MAMSTMKDGERLELLKEVGGTKVYEERRRESVRILDEAASRAARIAEVVAQLDARLAELDSERAELAKFQAKTLGRSGGWVGGWGGRWLGGSGYGLAASPTDPIPPLPPLCHPFQPTCFAPVPPTYLPSPLAGGGPRAPVTRVHHF